MLKISNRFKYDAETVQLNIVRKGIYNTIIIIMYNIINANS